MLNRSLIDNINQLYSLGIISADLLRESSDNHVWLLSSSDGRKYVARISKRNIGDDISFEIDWINFFFANGVPVAPIIKTSQGRFYANLSDGSPVVIFVYVAGSQIKIDFSTPPPLQAVLSAATALAKLHNASQNYKTTFTRPRTVFSELERVSIHREDFQKNISGGQRLFDQIEQNLNWAKSYSYDTVLVHNDFRVDNIIFSNNEVAAIIDFDWCCLGPAIKDVAHALAEWSFPDGASAHWGKPFKEFLNSYNQAALKKIPLDNDLYHWIAFSCLSDAATYLVDRLEKGETKPPDSSYMYAKFNYFFKKLF